MILLFPLQILTKDSVTVSVDAVIYFKIFNPFISIITVKHASASTRLLAQTTLRNILGTKNLTELLIEREEISNMLKVGNGILLFTDFDVENCAFILGFRIMDINLDLFHSVKFEKLNH